MKNLRRLSLLAVFWLLTLIPVHSANATIPGCTQVNTPPFWVDNGTTVVQCPDACPDGSFLQCDANVQVEVQCVNGDIELLGQSRPGSIIDHIGQCPVVPPKACGANPSGTTWWQDSGTTLNQQCAVCADGTPQICTYDVQAQYQCNDGVTSATGTTKLGDVLGQVNQCPAPTPKACGTNPSGTSWFQDSGTTTTQQCNTCPDGSPQFCIYDVQAQYKCNDGVTSATGTTKLGDVVGHQNECLPLPPMACGNEQSGATWWENSGTQTSVCETCWNGSQLTCTYNTQVQKLCTNGVTSSTGQVQQGSLIGENGKCPPQPRNCGNTPDGGTTWQDHGQTPPYQCDLCIDGTPHMCIAVLQQEMLCTNGVLSPTGKTQDGPVLGYSNTCPNVVPGKETYQVPTAAPKADVLFVLDTSPTMYKTLLALAQRFKSLISSWSDVDWQIGIVNSAAVASTWDHHPSQGLLLELNPYPMDVNGPLMFLTPDQNGARWIFRRNVSFNGLSWPGDEFCDQQPYCQDGTPEPLHEISRAISRHLASRNAGFFRSGSTFVPIIVSAHDEPAKGTQPADVIKQFTTTMSSMSAMKGYSIVIQPGDAACLSRYQSLLAMGSGGAYGGNLAKFAKLSGGQAISICQNDYAKPLANLSQVVRQQVSSVSLQHVPYGNSLKITFSPSVPNIKWVLQGTQVLFNQPLPPGTSLNITYLYSP